MKNVLLLAHDDVGQEARLQAGLDLVRLLDGHLMCLDVTVPPPALVDDSVGAVVGTTLLVDEINRETANRSTIERRLAIEDVSWDWIDTVGRLSTSLRRASRFADLIVVNRRLDAFPMPDMRAVAGEVIVKSGKPVLAVPDDGRGFAPDSAIVAWNGSSSAITAMQRAIPLLQHSAKVILTEIAASGDDSEVEEAARYLSRYGIRPRIERVTSSSDGIGQTLIGEARRHAAGLVVAGGFGHMRLHEALFGGVTRELLTHCPCPVFVAH